MLRVASSCAHCVWVFVAHQWGAVVLWLRTCQFSLLFLKDPTVFKQDKAPPGNTGTCNEHPHTCWYMIGQCNLIDWHVIQSWYSITLCLDSNWLKCLPLNIIGQWRHAIFTTYIYCNPIFHESSHLLQFDKVEKIRKLSASVSLGKLFSKSHSQLNGFM